MMKASYSSIRVQAYGQVSLSTPFFLQGWIQQAPISKAKIVSLPIQIYNTRAVFRRARGVPPPESQREIHAPLLYS